MRLGDIDLLSEKEESSPITIKVKEVRAHPRFSRVGFYNDIAVLVLEENVRKNKYVIPVCLPQPTLKKSRLPGERHTDEIVRINAETLFSILFLNNIETKSKQINLI